MRIALLTPYPNDAIEELITCTGPLQHPGSWLANLPLALERYTDLEVHIVTDSDRVDRDVTVQRGRLWFHVVRVPSRLGLITNYRPHIARLSRMAKRLEPHVVHCQGTDHYGVAALEMPFPKVVTVHGVRSQEGQILAKGWKNHLCWQRVIRFEDRTLREMRYLVLISPYIAQFANRYTWDYHVLIENSVDETYFCSKPAFPIQQILFVGALDVRKRLLDLFRAMVKLRECGIKVPLHIVSQSVLSERHPYQREMREFIAEHCLVEYIVWRGKLLPSQIRDILCAGTVLVLPSAQETAPVVISEAMVCGVPVVATRVGGVPWMVRDGETGYLVHVGDVAAIADRIQRLIEDPELAEQMGRNARKQAIQRFHPEVAAVAHERFYREVYDGSRR